jgi:uncharacterized membrane-anchored protein YitT (DUF2179 family)
MTIRTDRFLAELKNLIYLVLGCTLLAAGVVLFLVPNKIATGGTPGVAILLHFLTGLPVGGLMVAINAPLLLAGFRYLGKSFAGRTVAAIVLSALLVDLFAEFLQLQPLSNNTLLATLYGGIVIGVGIGLILRGNASSGGSTIVARIVASRCRFKPGQVILSIDALIIVSSGLVFQDIDRALWSLISIYVTSKCIDMVLTGAPSEKVAHIGTYEPELIRQKIIDGIGEHGTILRGTDLCRAQERTLLFVTVEVPKINLLRDIIKQNDPEAFMVLMDASEMLGRGHGG